jgi:hypothetical protein
MISHCRTFSGRVKRAFAGLVDGSITDGRVSIARLFRK